MLILKCAKVLVVAATTYPLCEPIGRNFGTINPSKLGVRQTEVLSIFTVAGRRIACPREGSILQPLFGQSTEVSVKPRLR